MLLLLTNLYSNSNKSDFNVGDVLDKIIPIITIPMYDMATENLDITLESYLGDISNIKAVEIYDDASESVILTFYRENHKMIFNSKIPEIKKKYDLQIKKIFFDDEYLGMIKLYYTDSLLDTELTKEEKTWIFNNIVTIGVGNWRPISFYKNNTIDGFSGDIFKLIVERTGLKVRYVTGDWLSLLEDFQKGEIDILPDVFKTKTRMTYGLFSQGYLKLKDYFYISNHRNDIKSFKDLSGKTIVIVEAFSKIKIISDKFPKIKVVKAENLDDAINMVLSGKVDALFENQITVQTKLLDEMIVGLKGISQHSVKAMNLHFMSNHKKPLLHSILNKALNSISTQKKNSIALKWIKDDSKIDLSNMEKEWLSKEEAVKYVFDPDWKPMEWQNNLGKHQGIISDILKLIEEKGQIRFEVVKSDTWSKAIENVKSKKAIMFSGIGETKERKEYLKFTSKPVFSTNYVFVTKKDKDSIRGFKHLENNKLILIKDSTIFSLVKEKYKDLQIHTVDTITAGFDNVSQGKADIFVVSGSNAKYYINILEYNNLTINYRTNFTLDLKIGVRKDSPIEILSIINKSIDKISKKELSDILHKWTVRKVKDTTDWILIAKISGVIFIVILLMLWHNRKLSCMVKSKTADLQELAESLEIKVEERTAELQEKNKRIRDSIKFASLIQGALLPTDEVLQKYTKEHFSLWKPKDTVGGDIYLIAELKFKKEILIMVIDGAGHGVPGAFVTMLVKAIETQIIADIEIGKLEPNPAKILEYFNRTIKTMLKQEKGSKSNAGFDGGILYFNKETKVCKYAGAKTPLYIIQDGKLIKYDSDRKSVGFVRTKIDQKYTEYYFKIQDDMQLYLATDGIIDQEGKNDSRYGKTKFEKLILEHHKKSMENQKSMIQSDFENFKSAFEQSDDVTVLGLKF